jgi:hypothetical protein
MALKARNALRLLENDVTRILPVLNSVAGCAAPLHGGMDVISGGVVGVALQAVGVLVDSSGMRSCITQTRTHEAGDHQAKCEL